MNHLRLKKAFKVCWLFVGIFAIIYSLKNDYKYIFTLLSALLSVSIIPYLVLLKRNLKISKTLFKYRFFWFYPLITLTGVSIFSSLRFLLRNENPNEKVILIALGISLLIGSIWGIKEYLKVRGKKSENELFEHVDMIDSEYNTQMSGVLALNTTHEISFYQKNLEIFKINKIDIKNIYVNIENKLFPTHFLIELNNGLTYGFDSQFPHVWEKELLK